MKITTLLCTLLLVTNSLSAKVFSKVATNPVIPTLSNLSVCDTNNDGIAIFNLTLQTPIILAAQSSASSNYTVNYYLSYTDAVNGFNAVASPNTYTNMNNQQTIYVRVVLNGTTQYAVGSFSLIANPLVTPIFTPISSICQGSNPPTLPAVSNNAIAGTWSPSTIDTSLAGTYTLTFTPNIGQCSFTVTTLITVNPLPTIITTADFLHCDDDGANDGYYQYNLSSLIPTILGSQNPSDFTIVFYENQMSAENNVNPILNLINYQTFTHSIWIRVINNASGCYAISHFNTTIEQSPTPVITSNSDTICIDYLTHSVLRDATLTASNTTSYLAQNSPSYTYQWLDTSGTPIATNATYTVSSPFSNSTSGNFSVMMSSTSTLGCSSISQPFVNFQSGPASPIGIGYSIVNNTGNQTITVNVSGYGTYEYQLDATPRQLSNVFSNVTLGTHNITIWDTEGGIANSCDPIILSNIDVNLTATPAPTGNTTQSFSQGATLANMQVTGQNVQWYSGVNKMASSSSLPLNTILVNGTTYYASQKIGGYESTTRLPVTAQIVLNNAQFELKGLTYAPNPVESNLFVKSDDVIDNISIYNFLGQLIVTKKYNTTNVQMDLTSLNSGNYFIKLTSGNKQSTIKIEKK